MNVALRQPISLAEFLDWEERQELRYESDGFQASAMVGGTAAHAIIQGNLMSALITRLRGQVCQPFGSDATVFARERERWVGSLLTGDVVLAMPDIGIDIPLAELYEGLDLTQPAGEASA